MLPELHSLFLKLQNQIKQKEAELQKLKGSLASVRDVMELLGEVEGIDFEIIIDEDKSDEDNLRRALAAASMTLAEKVDASVVEMPQDFSTSEICDYMEMLYGGINRANVSTILAGMVDEGKLSVLRKGQGRAPTIFHRIHQDELDGL
ncbi:hypothetical protein [Cerasicoccus frondis]|uniref:hypothetical protein n=1 Tax=Cerasicoccus frondis TaxID=490090 RepID=UPI002852602C|nr:hypothetical protein [Cerasicoccus frondis]